MSDMTPREYLKRWPWEPNRFCDAKIAASTETVCHFGNLADWHHGKLR
ncbi:MAG: hypothetical protein NZM42_11455 [Gemmatales bacterium]|nr:hypothetical protein [Gemmatales bacterium]